MGSTTDFLGHIDISPGLNEVERAYLSAFGHTRRYDRGQGPTTSRPTRTPTGSTKTSGSG